MSLFTKCSTVFWSLSFQLRGASSSSLKPVIKDQTAVHWGSQRYFSYYVLCIFKINALTLALKKMYSNYIYETINIL